MKSLLMCGKSCRLLQFRSDHLLRGQITAVMLKPFDTCLLLLQRKVNGRDWLCAFPAGPEILQENVSAYHPQGTNVHA